ncbi:hypothetical protein CDD82_7006 [Ophiocordyceps australis]|uniref:Uncharacterized protein n=1 Tax=Ophiocordyceps australis TaxID=1399860 RepID=A0A2C5YUD0_9HYPO|nr:hypothetical protein CDD82_7006 [Ophiocordyceps australis]
MSKAGKGDGVDAGAVGSQHPVPENIPHLSSPMNGGASAPKHAHHGSTAGIQAGSPVKESSFLHRQTSAEDGSVGGDAAKLNKNLGDAAAVGASGDGIPTRS